MPGAPWSEAENAKLLSLVLANAAAIKSNRRQFFENAADHQHPAFAGIGTRTASALEHRASAFAAIMGHGGDFHDAVVEQTTKIEKLESENATLRKEMEGVEEEKGAAEAKNTELLKEVEDAKREMEEWKRKFEEEQVAHGVTKAKSKFYGNQ
ncbi:hypothetical protein HDV00_006000 [Rhizophlyctis rosea]|nr:hypothetical protein HDV00_006000 [Rhizophlyctis rosea]